MIFHHIWPVLGEQNQHNWQKGHWRLYKNLLSEAFRRTVMTKLCFPAFYQIWFKSVFTYAPKGTFNRKITKKLVSLSFLHFYCPVSSHWTYMRLCVCGRRVMSRTHQFNKEASCAICQPLRRRTTVYPCQHVTNGERAEIGGCGHTSEGGLSDLVAAHSPIWWHLLLVVQLAKMLLSLKIKMCHCTV